MFELGLTEVRQASAGAERLLAPRQPARVSLGSAEARAEPTADRWLSLPATSTH